MPLTNPLIAGNVAFTSIMSGSAKRNLLAKADEIWSAKNTGAVGDGASPVSDQAGFAQAFTDMTYSANYTPGILSSNWCQPQNGLFLPAGVYDIGDVPLPYRPGPYPSLYVWCVPGTVIIRVPAGKYAFTANSILNNIYCYGLTFIGGKGGFQNLNTEVNVQGMFIFERCYFSDYSECAIGNNSPDNPYWRIRNCFFMSAYKNADNNYTRAIGIAIGGYLDSSLIECNNFLRNEIHLKIGPRISSTVVIRNNDFIKWNDDTPFIAYIWFVPSTDANAYGVPSGQGSTVMQNKFGNENMNATDIRILVCTEEASNAGNNRQTRRPSYAWVTGGANGAFLVGLTVEDNGFFGVGALNSPLMRSYIAELRNFTYSKNRHAGGNHSYLVEFMGDRRSDYANTDWTVELGMHSLNTGQIPFTKGIAVYVAGGVSYNVLLGPYPDAVGSFHPEQNVMLPPSGGGGSGQIRLGSARGSTGFTTEPGVTVAATANRRGFNYAAVVESTGNAIYFPIGNVLHNTMTCIELTIAKGGTNPVGSIVVALENYNDANRRPIFRTIAVPDKWEKVRVFLMMPNSLATAWNCKIGPSTPGSFKISDVHVYHGREAGTVEDIQTLATGAWDDGHLIMGNYHLWIDATGKLRMKNGAPTGDLEGVVVGPYTV